MAEFFDDNLEFHLDRLYLLPFPPADLSPKDMARNFCQILLKPSIFYLLLIISSEMGGGGFEGLVKNKKKASYQKVRESLVYYMV